MHCIFVSSFCHDFPTLFRHRFWYLFLHSFWKYFGYKMAAQISYWGTIFGKKEEKCVVPPTAVGILSPTLRPTTHENLPKSHFTRQNDRTTKHRSGERDNDRTTYRTHDTRTTRRTTKRQRQRNDERGNDKTTPPFGKEILRPGGMRACALNPPPPLGGRSVLDRNRELTDSKASAASAHSAGPVPK